MYMLVSLNACVLVCSQMCLFCWQYVYGFKAGHCTGNQQSYFFLGEANSSPSSHYFSKVFFFCLCMESCKIFTPSILTCSLIMYLFWFGLSSHFWVRVLHSWLPWVLTSFQTVRSKYFFHSIQHGKFYPYLSSYFNLQEIVMLWKMNC